MVCVSGVSSRSSAQQRQLKGAGDVPLSAVRDGLSQRRVVYLDDSQQR